jgi:hypothetical protein
VGRAVGGWPLAFLPWLLAFALALAWGIGPALPALWHGQILGQPFTDLYPSVWGMGWFAKHQPGLPLLAKEIAWPEGTGFYYSSPIHGWLAWPLLRAGLTLPATYDLLVVASRVATVLLTFAWLRAEGFGAAGSLAGAAVYGCAPFFQGYAVEGIVEGLDGWTLPLWGLAVARKKPLASVLSFALVVASSWYLGLAACLVAVVEALDAPPRRGLGAFLSAVGGCLLAVPLWFAFSHAFTGAAPLADEVRRAMGTDLVVPRPGLASGLYPFAKCSYLGWVAGLFFLAGARRHPLLAAGAVLAWVLSLGAGPWYQLPVLSSVRFPYRFVAATLFLAAPIVASAADRRGRFGWLAMPAILLEGLLLSPVEPVIPGSPSEVPAVYRAVEPTVLLEVPGPVAMPPGVVNRSRERARYLLYYQAFHGAASPWRFDFNSVAAGGEPEWLASWVAQDPLSGMTGAGPPDAAVLAQHGVAQVMVHRQQIDRSRLSAIDDALGQAGFAEVAHDADLQLYRRQVPDRVRLPGNDEPGEARP